MNAYQMLNTAIADSVTAVGRAVSQLSSGSAQSVGDHFLLGWSEQFSNASLDERRARRTVDALYRAATVRL